MSLSKEELKKIVSLLGRKPSSIEQALFSALWSEHCSYKSSKIHLKKFPQSSKCVVSSFGENAGVIDLGKGERVAFKMESHNHPSRIVPFHGAMTGVGGILRDVFAMNARPIALANYLCFGALDYSITKGLVDGVVRGIGGYGNCIGLPMITGHTEFHPSYNENILVNALALGLYEPEDQVMTSKIKESGAYVVYAGAQTGRDGIYGAVMASESFEEEPMQKSTVQVGDPFFGKLLMEACLESMKEQLVLAVQDMGAAGLISSSFEMAGKSHLGMKLYLDRVPLRDSTMTAEEILLSESQERMLLICSPKNYSKLESLFKKWNLSICVLGEVIAERKMNLFWKEQLLTSIDPLLLTEKAPKLNRPYEVWSFPNRTQEKKETLSKINNKNEILLKLLSSDQGRSKASIYSQFDQRVGARTAGDCSFPIGIVQLPSKRFLALALGGRPHILNIDAFIGGGDAVYSPALELACRGFQPLAVTDCLNFGNPEKKEIMSQFSSCVTAMATACEECSLPVISGNVSFYNESAGQNIIPTSSTGLVGLRDQTGWPQHFFEKSEENIYLIPLHQCFLNTVNSFFNPSLQNCFYGNLNAKKISVWMHQLIELFQKSFISSSRLVGRWGLGYTLSQMTMVQGVGVDIQWDGDPFQERLYEIVLAVSENQTALFEKQCRQFNLPFIKIGRTGGSCFIYKDCLNLSVQEIQKHYNLAYM